MKDSSRQLRAMSLRLCFSSFSASFRQNRPSGPAKVEISSLTKIRNTISRKPITTEWSLGDKISALGSAENLFHLESLRFQTSHVFITIGTIVIYRSAPRTTWTTSGTPCTCNTSGITLEEAARFSIHPHPRIHLKYRVTHIAAVTLLREKLDPRE